VRPSHGKIELAFANTGQAGAVFHVYDKNHLDRVPRRYTVGAGDEMSGEWDVRPDSGAYDLWVLGPNGFHRHLTGTIPARHQREPEPEVRIGYDRRHGGLELELLNRGDAHCIFRLTSNAYHHRWDPLSIRVGARDHRDHFLPLRHSANWYDFTLGVVGLPTFARRFAGRVETGRHSLSDPGLGGRARGEQG
jgi:phospholipase C